MAKEMEKLYEFAYLAPAEFDGAGITSFKNDIDALVVKCGGSIRGEQETSRRPLAYPVNNVRAAHLVSELITIAPSGKTLLEKELRLDGRLIRHMFISMTEKILRRVHEQRATESRPSRKETQQKEKAAIFKRPAAPATEKPAEEQKADIAEIEKKLDEILGRDF